MKKAAKPCGLEVPDPSVEVVTDDLPEDIVFNEEDEVPEGGEMNCSISSEEQDVLSNPGDDLVELRSPILMHGSSVRDAQVQKSLAVTDELPSLAQQDVGGLEKDV